MPKIVYINTTASDTGRQQHSWTTWSDTEIVLDPISRQGLSGSTFYYKVSTDINGESEWYGPVTVGQEVDVIVTLAKEAGIVNLRDLTTSALLQFAHMQSISTDSWDLFKKVYINNIQSDTGQQQHNFITWSDTEVVLSPINKQSISGNTFYFKVENTEGTSSWYGPILIGEVYNELITLLTTPSIISTGEGPSTTIINAILNIGQLVGANITGHELGAALLNISQNVNLDVDTQAVLNAAIFLLQSGTISPEDFGSVINAVLSFDTSQTTITSQYEPPAVHKVKFIRLKLKP